METGNNTSMSVNKLESGGLDEYNPAIKWTFEIVSFVCIIYSMFALVALRRTKNTPDTAKFFSSALITYDIIAVFCFNLRKLITDLEWNIMIQVIGVSFCCMAFITIGLMSLERLVIFYSPYFYLKYMDAMRVKKAAITFWLIYFASYWCMRMLVCATVFPPFSYMNLIGVCNGMNFVYYGCAIGFVCITTLLCYAKIGMIIRKEHTQTRSMTGVKEGKISLKYLRSYRSTSLVLVYGVTTIASAVMYAIILSMGLEPVYLRMSIDVVNSLCCMMDPLVYVIWYRECRMELLKLVAYFIPVLGHRVERMRRDIFFITN